MPKHVVSLQTLHPGVLVFMKTWDTEEIIQNLHDLGLGIIESQVEAADLPVN